MKGIQTESVGVLVDGEEIRRVFVDPYLMHLRSDQPIKVRLIISALGLEFPGRAITNRLGKVAGISKLGFVHSAVQLGPVIIEWDRKEIVVITLLND